MKRFSSIFATERPPTGSLAGAPWGGSAFMSMKVPAGGATTTFRVVSTSPLLAVTTSSPKPVKPLTFAWYCPVVGVMAPTIPLVFENLELMLTSTLFELSVPKVTNGKLSPSQLRTIPSPPKSSRAMSGPPLAAVRFKVLTS
ncbi:hypothetical protein D3C86_1348400 [compost metagenome]